MHIYALNIARILFGILPFSHTVAFAAPLTDDPASAFSTILHSALAALWGLSLFFIWRLGKTQASQRNAAQLHQKIESLQAALEEKEKTRIAAVQDMQELRSLVDLAQVAIFRTTVDGSRFLFLNKACAERLGYESTEHLSGMTSPISLHPDPAVREALIDVLNLHGRVENMELELISKDGSIKNTLVNATLHRKEGYIQGAVMDITEHKEAEQLLHSSHTFLQNMLNALPAPVFFKDQTGRYQLINKPFEEFVGKTSDQILGKTAFDITSESAATKYHEMDTILFQSSGPAIQRYEYTFSTPSGPREAFFSKESMFDEDGQLIGLVGVIIDITDRKRMESSLRRAEERYRALYMNATEGIFTATADRRLEDVNPTMARMFGYDSSEEMVRDIADINTSLFADPAQCRTFGERLTTETAVSRFETQATHKDGHLFWISISAQAIFNAEGTIERYEGLIMDITAQKLAEQELTRMTVTDPLTAVANRIGMSRHLDLLLAKAARSQCQMSLLFIDLDDFKPINDRYGHQTGDLLLQQVAERLASRLRSADLASRVGGDEFAVLLWDVDGPAAVERVSRELLAALLLPYECGEIACNIGVSIGASLYPHHGTTASELLSAADSAMYEAKRAGVQFRFAPLPDTI